MAQPLCGNLDDAAIKEGAQSARSEDPNLTAQGARLGPPRTLRDSSLPESFAGGNN